MPTVGVVIPVYRGATVLPRAAGSLIRQRLEAATTMHVVIAVNDGLAMSVRAATEAVAGIRAAGHRAEPVESRPGRAAAFNRAERMLPGGPRLYLDQDAQLSPESVQSLATALAEGTGIHFAAPHLRLAVSPSRLTRWYYSAWEAVPYVRESPVTVGAYAVSAAGRRRWEAFPDIHSDDKWVRLHFAADERRIVEGSYEVVPPATLTDLVRARRRYLRGNAELRRVAPWTERADGRRYAGIGPALLTHPRRWAPAVVLLGVGAVASLMEAVGRTDAG